MKRLLMGLMLLVTAGAVSAEWTVAGGNDQFVQYVDRATIRRNGNSVKMWDLFDYKTVQKRAGDAYLSVKSQSEYDCKEEQIRILALLYFSGKMGSGKVVYSTSEASTQWRPISPASIGETLWKVACGKY